MSLDSCSHPGLVSLAHIPLEKMVEQCLGMSSSMRAFLTRVHNTVPITAQSCLKLYNQCIAMLIRLKKEAQQWEQQEQCFFIMEVLQVLNILVLVKYFGLE